MPAPLGNKFAIGNKGGHPTIYGEDIVFRTKEYIKQAVDGFEKIVESVNDRTGRKRFVNKVIVKLPSIVGLANYLNTSKENLQNWSASHKEFFFLLEKVKQLQEERLINKGISGDYNSNIAKLILTKHGYSDRQEVEHSGSISLTDILSGINDRKNKR